MNPAPLILKDGEVADFSVTESSPIFNDVERAKKISALMYYEEQTGNLMKLYEQKGKDIFVAKYTLRQKHPQQLQISTGGSKHDQGRHEKRSGYSTPARLQPETSSARN
jgi:hypothetical protein